MFQNCILLLVFQINANVCITSKTSLCTIIHVVTVCVSSKGSYVESSDFCRIRTLRYSGTWAVLMVVYSSRHARIVPRGLLITPRAYAQAGLSNRFCPSVVVVVVCHTKILKKPSNGRFRGYRNSLNFRCENIFVRRKYTKIFYTNIILQRNIFSTNI